MSFAALPISTVMNVSVATVQQGVGAYNTSNLAIFTRESYAPSFGVLGYSIYLSPTQVGLDFGTGSDTYAMANAVFSQQPNILAPGGYLVVIPYLSAAQDQQIALTFPVVPASGTFEITYNANSTTALQFNATASAIQTALQLVTGLSSATVTGSFAEGFAINSMVSGVGHPFTISSNSLQDSLGNDITPVITVVVPGSTAETLDQAILRTEGLVQYFGIMTSEILNQVVTLASAATVQPLNKLLFIASITAADVAPDGLLDLVRSSGYTQTRCLFYGGTLVQGLVFMASYAGAGLSVIFAGSNTTITMDLKTLPGVSFDPTMNPTLYNQCVAAGADVYASIQGIPKVLCSGANDFFDNQYNLQWFAGALQVAGFNYLATVSTKIPQTEAGMDGLKASLRTVCDQAVNNQFLAPGAWNSPTTFGNQAQLIANVAQRGYYIYSSPVSQQLQSARVQRQAPPIQIAAKYAGAIQSGTIIVYVNP